MLKESLPTFSLVIPVYNEEDAIASTVSHLHQILQSYEYEIVVVNDGSTDSTSQVLSSITDITLIEHNHNRGYGAALKTGIRQAQYPLIVITDADGTILTNVFPTS